MVRPAVWNDPESKKWWYDEEGNVLKLGCGQIDTPKDSEIENYNGYEPDCLQMWLSNDVVIPGNSTIPDEHSQPWASCEIMGTTELHVSYPWMSPGAAPIFSPCGTMGGNPYGCEGTEKFGDICPCAGDVDLMCDTFAFGGIATDYDWPDAPTTEWKAGTIEEVVWYAMSFGEHGGGYSFRLCKTPEGGISDLTEECFQDGYLEFAGDKNWVEYHIDRLSGERTEFDARRTTEGTFPPGSMWTEIPISPASIDPIGEDYKFGHVIDNIKIPSSLEPGEYVLSFRWDTKCTPEVFSSCANIRITN